MKVFKNYINGEWVAGETFENRNPANTNAYIAMKSAPDLPKKNATSPGEDRRVLA